MHHWWQKSGNEPNCSRRALHRPRSACIFTQTPFSSNTQALCAILEDIGASEYLAAVAEDYDDDALKTLSKFKPERIASKFGLTLEKARAFVAKCRQKRLQEERREASACSGAESTAPASAPPSPAAVSIFGIQLIIRRQRYDSFPSVSEQQDSFNDGKSYIRFCIDGPHEELARGVQVTFAISASVKSYDMHAIMNSGPEYPLEEFKGRKKGNSRVYGRVPDIHNHNMRLLFEPQYKFDGEQPCGRYPFMEITIAVGGKKLQAKVHSFHFKEMVDINVLKCVESHKMQQLISSKLRSVQLLKQQLSIIGDGEIRDFLSGQDTFRIKEKMIAKHVLTPIVEHRSCAAGGAIDDDVSCAAGGGIDDDISGDAIHDFLDGKDTVSELIKEKILVKVELGRRLAVDEILDQIAKDYAEDIEANKEQRKAFAFESLETNLSANIPLAAWDDSGKATALSVLETFKYIMEFEFEAVSAEPCSVTPVAKSAVYALCRDALAAIHSPCSSDHPPPPWSLVQPRHAARTLVPVLLCIEVLLRRNSVLYVENSEREKSFACRRFGRQTVRIAEEI